jgi:hypothetical protein
MGRSDSVQQFITLDWLSRLDRSNMICHLANVVSLLLCTASTVIRPLTKMDITSLSLLIAAAFTWLLAVLQVLLFCVLVPRLISHMSGWVVLHKFRVALWSNW